MKRLSGLDATFLEAESPTTHLHGVGIIRIGPGEDPISLEDLEKMHIQQVLSISETLDQAAKTLGIDASTLYRKRKTYSIG